MLSQLAWQDKVYCGLNLVRRQCGLLTVSGQGRCFNCKSSAMKEFNIDIALKVSLKVWIASATAWVVKCNILLLAAASQVQA